MKRLIGLTSTFIIVMMMIGTQVLSQTSIQYYRPNNKSGINVFETSKVDTVKYDGLKVWVGGDFTMQFQGLRQTNSGDSLVDLVNNFNLPTANLNLDVQLEEGLRLHLRTYLSARHHTEAWVKGGFMQIDNLDFIKPDLLSGVMEVATIRVGLDEINYGDAHFRRTDNARALFNPFVGNYLMDAFVTEAFGEVLVQKNGLIGMLAVSNGKLNQNVAVDNRYNGDNKLSFYGKVGYDNQLTDDLRLRLTGSWYINKGTTTGTYVYGGDRGGSRYYSVMHTDQGTGSDFDGRVNSRFTELTAIQINPFVKFKGLEFFGIYELASGSEDGADAYTQLAAEALYRFGDKEQYYAGGRFNTVNGKYAEAGGDQEVQRVNLGAGWFMTKNVLTKLEYVKQTYDGDGFTGTRFQEGEFEGFMIEAVIGF
jgi:hypothetical protein